MSNEYLSFRFGCIIEPTGFIMNKHTKVSKVGCRSLFKCNMYFIYQSVQL